MTKKRRVRVYKKGKKSYQAGGQPQQNNAQIKEEQQQQLVFAVMQELSTDKTPEEVIELLQKQLQAYQISGMISTGEAIYQQHLKNINALLDKIDNKLKKLKIDLPDFQTNFMIKLDLSDLKALDYGLAKETVP